MSIEFINPEGLYAAPRGFSQIARMGNIALISGQTAQDTHGDVVGKGDPVAQAERVYQNMKLALESLGATFANVAKLTSYFTDRAHWEATRDVRRRYMGDHVPANTVLIVAGLANPGFLMEVEAVVDLSGL